LIQTSKFNEYNLIKLKISENTVLVYIDQIFASYFEKTCSNQSPNLNRVEGQKRARMWLKTRDNIEKRNEWRGSPPNDFTTRIIRL
jgi:nanoRNase/pAp phosphatase (c-di-AMP/oligoRNAs hydrolase)